MRARKILIPLLIVVVVLVLLAPLALRALFPEPKLRAMVLPRAEAALGRPVDCGRIGLGLGLRGVNVELETLQLGADSTGYGLQSLDLPLLRARLAWLPLLRREVDIKTLTFVKPGVELLLPAAGDSVARRAADEAAGTAAVAVAAPDLRLEDARIRLRQEEGIDLELRVAAARFASNLSAAGDLDLSGRIDAAGLAGTLADGRAFTASAELELDLALRDGALDLRAFDLLLREAALDSGGGAPDLRAGTLKLVGKLAGPLAALQASPPEFAPVSAEFALSGEALRVELGGESPSSLGFDRLGGPIATAPGDRALDIALRAEGGAFAGALADGRRSAARLDGEAELSLAGERLELGRSAFDLGALHVDGLPATADAPAGPALDLTRARLELAGGLPLAALRAKPAELAAPGLALAGSLRVEGIALTRGGDAPLDLKLPELAGPVALGEATRGELRLSGATFAAGSLASTSPQGLRVTGTLPAGRADLSLKPEPTGTALPRLDLDLESYQLTSTPVAGKPTTLRGEGGSIRAQASLPADRSQLPRFRSRIDMKPLVMEGPGLAKPVRLEGIALEGDQDSLHVAGARLSAGESSLRASGRLDLPAARGDLPRLALRVTGPLLDLADFLREPAQRDGAAPPSPAPDGGAAPAPLVPPGRIDFAIDRLVHPRATVTGLRGRILAEPESLRLTGLDGQLMGGGVGGEIAITPRDDGKLACRGDFSVRRVQAPDFLAAFTPIQRGIEGVLSTDTDFDFLLEPGRKPEGLAVDAAVDLAEGALVDLPALQQLSRLAGLKARDRYALGDLAHHFQVRENRVLARDLRLPFEDGFLVATGSAGLDGTLDFRGKWELGRQTIARIGSGGVLAFLADAEGKVEIDFVVRGTTKSPVVTLDTQALRERLAEEARARLEEEGGDLLKKGLDALRDKLR